MIQFHWKKRFTAMLALFLVPGLAFPAPAFAAVKERGDLGAVKPILFDRTDRDRYKLPPHVEGEVIVRFKKQFGIIATKVKDDLKKNLKLQAQKKVPLIDAEVMKIPANETVESVIAKLKASGQVEFAQPNYVYKLHDHVTPTDFDWSRLWGLHNTGQPIRGTAGTPDIDIDAPEAWHHAQSLEEVIVAVIDSGVDVDHPDLAGKIWTNPGEIPGNGIDDDGNGYVDDVHGWDFANDNSSVFDPYPLNGDDHGTHVAGTIAAVADSFGVRGVAPNVKIMPLKFIGPFGGTTADAIKAIEYAAAKGARVANNSWGGAPMDTALNAAIVASGMVFVAAAGNAGNNNDVNPESPASLPASNILSVTAVDSNGGLPGFANWGPTSVDVAAPGKDIFSTVTRGYGGFGTAVQVNSTYKSMLWGFGLQELATTAEQRSALARVLTFLGLSADSPMLLVDDDESDKGYPDVRPAYLDALQALGYTNVTVHEVAQGADGPSAATMAPYAAVIWFTGLGFGQGEATLTLADQSAISSYLNMAGKGFFLSGEDATYGMEISSLLIDKLKTYWVGEYGKTLGMTGVAGTAMQGGHYSFSYPNQYRDLLDVYDPADATATVTLETLDAPDYTWAHDYKSGTSMAAPHVSGIAAVLMGQKNLTALEAIALIKSTGVQLPSLAGKVESGRLVNLHNAVATQVAQPAAAAGNSVPGAASAYSVQFRVSTYGKLEAGKDSITMTFPDGTTLPAAIPADQVRVNGISAGEAGAQLVTSGRTVTVPLPVTVAHGGEVQVEVAADAGLLNPSTPGSYSLTVHTSVDPVTAASTPYNVSADLHISLDAPSYRGAGSQDAAWDGDDSTPRLRKAQITLTDNGSYNVNPNAPDTVIAQVSSGADPAGISVVLTETGNATGTFRGRFGFSEQGSDDGGDLVRVSGPTTVTVSVGAATATADWFPADLKRTEIRGGVAVPAGADPAAVTAELFRDGAPVSARAGSGSGYTFSFSPGETGSYLVRAYGPGLYGETAAIPVTAATTGPVETSFDGAQWVDTLVLRQPDLSLAPDTAAPGAPAITAPANGQVFATPSVTVTGTAEPHATVTLSVGGPTHTVRADATGQFSRAFPPLSDGTYAVTAQATDLAGNASAPASSSFRVDMTPPAAPHVNPVDTDDTRVTGQAEPGVQVTVKAGAVELGTATASGSGLFSVPIPLQAKDTVLTVTVTDAANWMSPATEVTVQEAGDTTPPAAPTVDPVGDSDTRVTGTAVAGALVSVTAGAQVLGHATAGPGGEYSVAILRQPAGTVLAVVATDAGNNDSAPTTVTVIDNTPPASPVIHPVKHTDAAVTGTAEPGAAVEVLSGVTLLGAASAGQDGSFSVTISPQPAETVLTVRVVDGALNAWTGEVTVAEADLTPPPAPAVNEVGDTHTRVTGTAEAGATITVRAGAAVLGAGVTGPDGSFSVTIAPQPAGTVLSVTAADASGNESPATYVTVVDSTRPPAPQVNDIADTDTVVTGISEPDTLIRVKQGDTVLGAGPTDPAGGFAVTIPQQEPWTVLSVTATDAAGNESAPTTRTVLDRTPPGRPAIDPVTPASNALTGTAEPGSLIRATTPAGLILQGVADLTGAFRITMPRQAPGTVITVTARDAAGNVSLPATVTVTAVPGGNPPPPPPPFAQAYYPDLIPPAPPVVEPLDDNDTELRGTADRDAIVTATANGQTLGSYQAVARGHDLQGPWYIRIQPLKAGTVVEVTAMDMAKNVSKAVTVTVSDATAPAPPELEPVGDSDTSLSGSAEPGAAVTVSDGQATWTAIAGEDGTFHVSIDRQPAGQRLTAFATDEAGNAGEIAAVTVHDNTPPSVPTVDLVTNEAIFLTGTAEPGARIRAHLDGSQIGDVKADQTGAYRIPMVPQAPGTRLTLLATDEAVNVSPAVTIVVQEAGLARLTDLKAARLPDGTAHVTATVEPGAPGNPLRIDLAMETARPDDGSAAKVSRKTAEFSGDLLRAMAAADGRLRIEAGLATLELDAFTLADAITPADGTDPTVRVSLARLAGTELLQPALLGKGMSPATAVLALTVEVVNPATGQSRTVPYFSRKVTLRVPLIYAYNPAHVGVYRLNRETGLWEFRGGRAAPRGEWIEVGLSGFSEYVALEYTRHYDDVPADHWARADVELMTARHVVTGTTDTTFSPDLNVTRFEFAVMLTRALRLPPGGSPTPSFDDLSPEDWYYSAVEAVVEANLVSRGAGRFRPQEPITRQEMAQMLAQALRLNSKEAKLSSLEVGELLSTYTDVGTVDGSAREAMAYSVKFGLLVERTDRLLDPLATVTRAEATVSLRRLLTRLGLL